MHTRTVRSPAFSHMYVCMYVWLRLTSAKVYVVHVVSLSSWFDWVALQLHWYLVAWQDWLVARTHETNLLLLNYVWMQVKKPSTLSFLPLREALAKPEPFMETDFAKIGRPGVLHQAFRGLDKVVLVPWICCSLYGVIP